MFSFFRRKKPQEVSLDYPEFKIVLIGDAKVGKSQFVKKFLNKSDDESEQYEPTTEAGFSNKTMTIDGQMVKLQLWDVPGSVKDQEYQFKYLKNAQAVIVAFDMTDNQSFENVKYYIDVVTRMIQTSVPMILIGTKSDDLVNRKVNKNDIDKFVKQSTMGAFFEVSARTGEGVSAAINKTVEILFKTVKDTNPRQELINDLQKYIDRIEGNHKNKREAEVDFSYGFWFFKKSRAINRKINYYLAASLIDKLSQNPPLPIDEIFGKIDKLRKDVMKQFVFEEDKPFVKHGIYSYELNTIIDKAKKMMASESPSIRK